MDKPSAIVVKLPEYFNAKGARTLRRDLHTRIAASSPAVIVDLSRLKKIDVAGLDAFVAFLDEIARRDGALEFTSVSPEAATLLELTRMSTLLGKFPGFSIEAPVLALSPEPLPQEQEESPVQLPAVA